METDLNYADKVMIAHGKLSLLESVHSQFINHIAVQNTEFRPPATLIATNEYIDLNWFRHTIKATPRIVRASNSDYQMEYAFFAEQSDKKIEVFRFFLRPLDSSHADLLLDAEGKNYLCEFKNPDAYKKITYRILFGMLKSNIYDVLENTDESKNLPGNSQTRPEC